MKSNGSRYLEQRHGRAPRSPGHAAWLWRALIALAVLVTPPIWLGAVSSAPATTLILLAPPRADVNTPFDIKLLLIRTHDVAGFESSVLFDPAGAELDQLQTTGNSVHGLGRDVGQLAAMETDYGAAIGFYSCPVSDCANNQSTRHTTGASDSVTLSTLTLIGNQPGTLDVTFDAAKAVDSRGNDVPLVVPNPTVAVRIEASAGAAPIHAFASPAGRWSLKSAGNGDLGPFSTTGSGTVTNSDVLEVAMAWENLREHGNPCGAVDPRLDVNHDGCIDVADVQLVASNLTPGATSTAPAPAAGGSTFVVNSTGDQDDAQNGDGTCQTSNDTCTLRAAITEANHDSGPNTIDFDIPGPFVHTIHLDSPLPTLWDTSGATTIDGYSQPGASPNTAPLVDNANINIQLEGGGAEQYDALPITSPGNLIRGLAFYNFQRSFWIYGSNAHDNVIVGCFVGTNVAGTFAFDSPATTEAHGIHIEQGAASNVIGRPNLADRNVISGNGRSGVGIWNGGSNNIVIQNNIVGLSPSGLWRVPNQLHGIDLNFGTQHDIVGGTGTYEHNVVSGNGSGIDVSHTSQTSHNQIVGNYIGTDVTGNWSPHYAYNTDWGIRIEDGVSFNTFSDNVIGGSSDHSSDANYGILIRDAYTSNNTIARNRIGVSLSGVPIPNGTGILVYGSNNTIGPGNIIAHNLLSGIEVKPGGEGDQITENSMFRNDGDGIRLDTNGNHDRAAPTIDSASATSASGTACGGCRVEVFIADSGSSSSGEGKTFVGAGVANTSGAFTISISGVFPGESLTATATDSSGDTSPFSVNSRVGGG